MGGWDIPDGSSWASWCGISCLCGLQGSSSDTCPSWGLPEAFWDRIQLSAEESMSDSHHHQEPGDAASVCGYSFLTGEPVGVYHMDMRVQTQARRTTTLSSIVSAQNDASVSQASSGTTNWG